MITLVFQETTSRQTFKILGKLTTGTLLASVCTLMPQAVLAAQPAYSVVSPLGEETVEMIAMSPRLDTLANKTICMIGNDAFKVNITMPAIASALQQHFAGIKIVPYTELPQAEPGASQVLPESIQSDFRSHGCDAVVSGNGG